MSGRFHGDTVESSEFEIEALEIQMMILYIFFFFVCCCSSTGFTVWGNYLRALNDRDSLEDGLRKVRVMANLPGYIRACLHTGKLAFLAILVSGGIVLQILACALYNNWWPMLTVIVYVLLPMPLLFFAGSDGSLLSESDNTWMNVTKFLTGASTVGSIAIPAILKHAGVIGWGALAMELSSFFVFVLAIMCYIRMDEDDDYRIF